MLTVAGASPKEQLLNRSSFYYTTETLYEGQSASLGAQWQRGEGFGGLNHLLSMLWSFTSHVSARETRLIVSYTIKPGACP